MTSSSLPSHDPQTRPALSLICATLGARLDELERLIASLEVQTSGDFELLVVYQGEGDDVPALCRAAGERGVATVCLSSPRGLSRARNVGIDRARGRYVAFPDDDAWYSPTFVEMAVRWLDDHPDEPAVIGRCMDGDGRPSVIQSSAEPHAVTRNRVIKDVVSVTIVARASTAGTFDERLGVGSDEGLGAGEETDYVLRLIGVGGELRYVPDIVVHHPQVASLALDDQEAAVDRARRYGRGLGFVAARHDLPRLALLARPLLACILSALMLNFPRARFYAASLSGRLAGLELGRRAP